MKKLAPFQSDPGEFPSGVIGFSPCVLELQDEIDLYFFLHRHLHGDDGDVPEGVHLKNLFAWRNGLRVWSTYNTTGSPDGRIWIVTEADRSATWLLLPSDYPACMLPPERSMAKIAAELRSMAVFPSGEIRMSNGTAELDSKVDVGNCLRRHLLGDDGDVSGDQHQKNLRARSGGLPLSSIYDTPETPEGKIWIVTEADRSATHILLPSEYGGRDERQERSGLFDIPGDKNQYSEFPQPSAGNGRKTVPSRTVTWSDPATESSSPVRPETPVSLAPESDRMPAMKCDMCGLRKESVRSRRRITIGLQSGTVRINFCDECAATIETLP